MAIAIGEWLQEDGQDLAKPIHRMDMRQLEGMAWAAVSRYSKLRELERQRENLSIFDENIMAIDQKLSNPLGVCAICTMQAKGFVVQFNPNVHLKKPKSVAEIAAKQGPFPQYSCCGLACSDTALKIVTAARGEMPANTITAMEKTAVQDAKQHLFEALTAIGAVDAFGGQSAQNMEYLIWHVWQGLKVSMHRQSAAGEIPF